MQLGSQNLRNSVGIERLILPQADFGLRLTNRKPQPALRASLIEPESRIAIVQRAMTGLLHEVTHRRAS
jgi:hypothetical protein